MTVSEDGKLLFTDPGVGIANPAGTVPPPEPKSSEKEPIGGDSLDEIDEEATLATIESMGAAEYELMYGRIAGGLEDPHLAERNCPATNPARMIYQVRNTSTIPPMKL